MVTVNPYQSPNTRSTSAIQVEDLTLVERLRNTRNAHRRWSRRCWAVGVAAMLAGGCGLNLSHTLYVNRNADSLVAAMGGMAIVLIATGFLTMSFGPISWFWFHRNKRSSS